MKRFKYRDMNLRTTLQNHFLPKTYNLVLLRIPDILLYFIKAATSSIPANKLLRH